MTITTNEHGQQNMFAKEPKMYITEEDQMKHEEETYSERVEKLLLQILFRTLLWPVKI